MQKKEEQILNPNSKLYKQIFYDYKFRKRTFKLPSDDYDHISFEEDVKLKLHQHCKECKSQLIAPHLKKAVQLIKSPGEGAKAECTFCGKNIPYPKLYVSIGKRIGSRSEPAKPVEMTPNFYSANLMRQEVEALLNERDQVKVDYLRDGSYTVKKPGDVKKQELFWNLIYYFYEYQLPFDFILPYE